MEPVSPAQDAPVSAQAVGKAEARREVIAITVVGNLAPLVDLHGGEGGLIAQPERERQLGRGLPLVAPKQLRVPSAEAAADVSDSERVLIGQAEPDIGDGVMSEIITKDVLTPVAGAFKPVDLTAHRRDARAQIVSALVMTQLGSVLE